MLKSVLWEFLLENVHFKLHTEIGSKSPRKEDKESTHSLNTPIISVDLLCLVKSKVAWHWWKKPQICSSVPFSYQQNSILCLLVILFRILWDGAMLQFPLSWFCSNKKTSSEPSLFYELLFSSGDKRINHNEKQNHLRITDPQKIS